MLMPTKIIRKPVNFSTQTWALILKVSYLLSSRNELLITSIELADMPITAI